MIPFAQSVDTYLRKLSQDALAQIDGVPDADLNEWRPSLGLQDINTFYALMTHLIGAGEYWVLHAAAGRPTDRNRPAEFVATGDLSTLKTRLETWLQESSEYLETVTEADLGREFVRQDDDETLTWSVARCLMHAVEHTAGHVGHLQIQRQIWNAERGVS
jgi:hypothetical protein